MTENELLENMEPFENPKLLPLEEVKLKIKTDGVIQFEKALDKRWVDDRYFLHYEAPSIYDESGMEIIEEKEHWLEIVNYMISDLKWLLSLPFYRFWSNIVFNASILNALVSFLQEAPPFYALENFPNDRDMRQQLESLHHLVLLIFMRLITNKKKPEEFMNNSFMGDLLYNNYIFTIPIIFDLCQLYGRENSKIMERMLKSLFTLEPRYKNDLEKTVPYLIEALENVEMKFDGYSSTNKVVSLSEKNSSSANFTLFNLQDWILYVLDITSTMTVFLKNYPPAVNIYRKENFMNKIVSIYENTIPEMYRKLNDLANNEENQPKFVELKHRLDVMRIEILSLFRIIIHKPILNIQKNLKETTETEIKAQIEEYLKFLLNAIGEKEFITDYNHFYPVHDDLVLFSTIYPDFDMVKYQYIQKPVFAIAEKVNIPTTFYKNADEAVAGPSGVGNDTTASSKNPSSSKEKKKAVTKNSIEFESLITGIKDVFPNLNDRFIEMCLQHYENETERVINAVLENSLPPKLNELKDTNLESNDVSSYYADRSENEQLAFAIQQMELEDAAVEDNVHEKRRENIEVPKDYIIRNYSLISDYDDEYDDTYDDLDAGDTTQNDSAIDSKSFTTPRSLRGKEKPVEVANQSESEDEDAKVKENGKDHFLQNPAELRAKAEQRRQSQGGRASANVAGKPKSQGQDKSNLQHSRKQKDIHKRQHANHNRHSGAQWKRNQGMIPS